MVTDSVVCCTSTYLHTDGIKGVVRANVTWNLQEQARGGGLTTHPPFPYHLITQKHIESTATKKKTIFLSFDILEQTASRLKRTGSLYLFYSKLWTTLYPPYPTLPYPPFHSFSRRSSTYHTYPYPWTKPPSPSPRHLFFSNLETSREKNSGIVPPPPLPLRN